MDFPRTLVFSSLDYMGLNLHHLHTLQEILRLKDIIIHNFNDTLTGRLYRTSIELFFIELGLPNNLCSYDYKLLDGLTTDSLVKSTMLFLHQYKILLRHSVDLRPLREYDSCIMSKLLETGAPFKDLLTCNHCRL